MLLGISGTELTQSLVIGTVNGAVYALIALSLVLVYRSSGIFNFAQAEFGTVAVYGAYFSFSYWGFPYVVAALFGVVCGIVAALLTERFVIRPLSQGPKVTLLVATAGIALLSIGVAFWRTGDNALRFFDPLTQWEGARVAGVQVSGQRMLTLLLLLVAVAALTAFFRSPYGLAVLAASQDADASALVGLDVNRISMLVWGIAGTLGAFAGILLQGGNAFTPGAITSLALIPGFTAAVIGGLTSLPGAVLGGMVIGMLESFGRLSTFDVIPGASSVSVFVVLLLVLLVRPEGLLGGRMAT
ncbi:MAG TPA: branched-chain amino acid ABC transporter permease [Acidimicrobiales bacterium]|nr:branched-chain amino acid ABC transporter permease [Acidimicrobiales bacterium]